MLATPAMSAVSQEPLVRMEPERVPHNLLPSPAASILAEDAPSRRRSHEDAFDAEEKGVDIVRKMQRLERRTARLERELMNNGLAIPPPSPER